MARTKRTAAATAEAHEEPAAAAPETPWREGVWAGLPNYECRRCPYATLSRERIEQHVRGHT